MLHESTLTSPEESFPIFVYKIIILIHAHRGENVFITRCYFTVESKGNLQNC